MTNTLKTAFFGKHYRKVDVDDRIAELTQEIEALQSKNSQLDTEKLSLTARRRSTQDELDTATTELADTRQLLEAANTDLSGVKGRLEATSSELTETRQRLESADGELAETRQRLETADSELAETRLRLETADGELAEKLRQLTAANTELSGIRGSLDSTNAALADLRREAEAAAQRSAERIQALEVELGAASADRDRICTEGAAKENAFARTEERMSAELVRLEETIRSSGRLIERLRQSGEEARAAGEEKDACIRAMEGDLAQLRALSADQAAKIDSQNTLLEEQAGQLRATGADRERLTAEAAEREREAIRTEERLKADVARLEETVAAANAQIADLKERLSDALDACAEAEKRANRLALINEKKQRALDECEAALAADPVGEAQVKAQEILEDATARSEQMLNEAQTTRDRVMTATRSAYYNTLQLKIALAERFTAAQKDLDSSIAILGEMDMPRLPENRSQRIDPPAPKEPEAPKAE